MFINTAIALASASVALAALFVSIRNVRAMRIHNELSVKPLLSIFTKISPSAPQLEIFIRNNGLGPAIINKVYVFIDDKKQTFEKAIHWKNIVGKIWDFDGMITGYAIQSKATEALCSNKELRLLSIKDDTQIYVAQELAKKLTRLQIEVYYESMYGKQFIETLREQKEDSLIIT